MEHQKKFTIDYSRRSIDKARSLRRSSTPYEKRLWQRIRGSLLGVHFRRQAPLGGYVVDFLCLECNLIVELDGWHHFTPEGQEYDKRRDQYLRARGFYVMRIPNDDLRNDTEGVLGRIRDHIRHAKETHIPPTDISPASTPSPERRER
jgi:very-short-patch-repair endonuclease